MYRFILVSLFFLVAFIGCETTDNPANTLIIPEDVTMTFTADPENLACGDAGGPRSLDNQSEVDHT